MKSGKIGAMVVLLAGAGWAAAQPLANGVPPGSAAPLNPPGSAPYGGAPGMVYPVVPAYGPGPVGGPQALPSDPVGGQGLIWYGSADYLLMTVTKGTIPSTAVTVPSGVISVQFQNQFFNANQALLRTSTVVGFTTASLNNQVGFGNGAITDVGALNGGRFMFGFWADPDMSYGLEAGFWMTERNSDRIVGRSPASNSQFIIDTGFTPTNFLIPTGGGTPQPLETFDALAIRQADSTLSGSTSTNLLSSELNYRGVHLRIGGTDVGCLVGARYLLFREDLSINSSVHLTRPTGIQDTATEQTVSLSQDLSLGTRDRTRLRNNFYGAQLGFDLDNKFGSLFLYTRFKVGVGNMHQSAEISSFTDVINNEPVRLTGPRAGSLTSPGTSSSTGGLLAAPGENGRQDRDRFAFIPEFNGRLGWQFTTWLRGYLGYDYIRLNHVARPGSSVVQNTITTNINAGNTNQNNNVAAPTFGFRDSNVTVQGFTVGLEAKY